jgi:hypothetical protein
MDINAATTRNPTTCKTPPKQSQEPQIEQGVAVAEQAQEQKTGHGSLGKRITNLISKFTTKLKNLFINKERRIAKTTASIIKISDDLRDRTAFIDTLIGAQSMKLPTESTLIASSLRQLTMQYGGLARLTGNKDLLYIFQTLNSLSYLLDELNAKGSKDQNASMLFNVIIHDLRPIITKINDNASSDASSMARDLRLTFSNSNILRPKALHGGNSSNILSEMLHGQKFEDNRTHVSNRLAARDVIQNSSIMNSIDTAGIEMQDIVSQETDEPSAKIEPQLTEGENLAPAASSDDEINFDRADGLSPF